MPPRGWVLYDEECGFCVGWLKWWAPRLRRHGFDAAPLQATWVAERPGAPADLLADIRLLTPAGDWLRGEAVYLHVARRIWWLRPLGFLLGLPGFRGLLRAGYRAFARRRYCIAGACYTTKD